MNFSRIVDLAIAAVLPAPTVKAHARTLADGRVVLVRQGKRSKQPIAAKMAKEIGKELTKRLF